MRPMKAAAIAPVPRMRPRALPTHAAPAEAMRPLIDIVIPVHNEERDLAPSVSRLHTYVNARFPFKTRITIVDNASTDSTLQVALHLSHLLRDVRALHLDAKGRGRALRAAWLRSDADVVAYMDVDLSTNLNALLPLVAPLLSGHSDVAIGSRLARGARVTRGPKRELISRAYNLLLHAVLRTRFRDAQCGFKAMRGSTARQLLPQVQDNAWFFDTELLVLAQHAGMRIHEVPVDWVDDPDSRVDIVTTARDDLAGVARMAWTLLPRMARFACIGVLSTAAYAALYVALRALAPPVAANAVALLVTAVGNTAANRRFTFGVRGHSGHLRHQAAGLVALGGALGLTSGAALALPHLAPHAGRVTELAALVSANVVATALRYLVLQRVIAPAERAHPAPLRVAA